MKNSTKRSAVRWLHIGVGSVIATYIYSPWGELELFQIAIKFFLIPLTVLSGLWLWKGHQLKGIYSKAGHASLSIVAVVGTVVVLMSFSDENRPALSLQINNVKKQGTLYINFCTKADQWSSNGKYHFKFTNPKNGTNSFLLTNIRQGLMLLQFFRM